MNNGRKIKIIELVRTDGTQYGIFVNLKYCRDSFRQKVVISNGVWAPVYTKPDSLDGVYNYSPISERRIYKTLDEAKADLDYIKSVVFKPEVISRTTVYSE